MITLIIGGSGSGKSAYAEDYIGANFKGGKKYYIATMKHLDKECEEKIKKHRSLRQGKGFFTIEQQKDIEKAIEKMEVGKKTALVECLSNLVANEMFSQGGVEKGEAVVERLIKGILEIEKRVDHLVLVGNNVFEDGNTYDRATMEYVKALGSLQQKLGQAADRVIEVVVGIPLVIKAGREESCI